jgi:hypothetical protein
VTGFKIASQTITADSQYTFYDNGDIILVRAFIVRVRSRTCLNCTTEHKKIKQCTSALMTRVHTEIRIATEFCTKHRNELDCSASVRTKRKLEKSGLEVSRFCCVTVTGSTTKVFWRQREFESYKYSRRNIRHSGDARLESWDRHRISGRFWWFSSAHQDKYRDSAAIRP